MSTRIGCFHEQASFQAPWAPSPWGLLGNGVKHGLALFTPRAKNAGVFTCRLPFVWGEGTSWHYSRAPMGGFWSHSCPPQGPTDRLQMSGRGWRGQPQGLLTVPVFSYVGPFLQSLCLGLCCSHRWTALFWASSPPASALLHLHSPARWSLPRRLLLSHPGGVSASLLQTPTAPTFCYHPVQGWPVVLPPCPSGLGTTQGQGLVCAPSTQQ